ncbi:MAG: twin-arginine translocation signal domain-containing protein [Pseudomonadota bacterium]|nr:twin-arginine translocation signal domain-containing protein [Pseudomonadota bacterium]
MRLIDKRFKISRRTVLKTTGAVAAATAVMPAGAINGRAFAAAPVALSENSFATLVKMARDIYPHDKIADQYYATVISGIDAAAKDDAALKTMLEQGVADLDSKAQAAKVSGYAAIAEETDRVAVLKQIETTPFFQKIRGDLITGIYNNKELWPSFGYEGESASKGGYVSRGFDDINWL